ncbi:Gti1/Pac2 family-domain-containing protein [Epithele typhae]|uniref:Gti1/Pac2 family-domain-containing protein n=1 Tax=Epithele typhae TaxID=378194 RepID=UPI002008B03F|nr:Gti1/Pac2 family-domain-containing protein [Epithele typhae]KAH9929587.1 Gti1/Pac2 family-domain-containing protein [Epithele typhae]
MQLPTFTGLRIRNLADAHIIFHAVSLGILPIVSKRLDIEERRYIHSGCVCVWEERNAGPGTSSAAGIERWTDGRRWGPSRVRDEFLYYQEKLPDFEADELLSSLIYGSRLIKQTYSVYVDTPTGRRKWHLVAYFTGETLERLCTIDDFPELAALRDTIPSGMYTAARMARQRARPDAASGPPLFGGRDVRTPSSLDSTSSFLPRSLYTLDSPPDGGPPVSQLFTLRPPASAMPQGSAGPGIHLPALKPPPWSPPRWPEEELRTRQPDLNCAQSAAMRKNHAIDLAPLIYLRKRPWPPRDMADDDVLQLFDCEVI